MFRGYLDIKAVTLTGIYRSEPYADLRSNESLCVAFATVMGSVGRKFVCDLDHIVTGGYGTDMG